MWYVFVLPIWMAVMNRLHGWGGFAGCRVLSQIGLSLPMALIAKQWLSIDQWYIPILIFAWCYMITTTATVATRTDNFISWITDRFLNKDSIHYSDTYFNIRSILFLLPLASVCSSTHHLSWTVSIALGAMSTGWWLPEMLVKYILGPAPHKFDPVIAEDLAAGFWMGCCLDLILVG